MNNHTLMESDLCYWNPATHWHNNDNLNCLWYKGKPCIECNHYMPRFVGYLKDCPVAKDIDNINARHKVKSN